MGTHGHSKLDDLMLGSVARDVVHGCPVPVMVVRLPKEIASSHRQEISVQQMKKEKNTTDEPMPVPGGGR
jgi:hypothetical protein